MDHLPKIDKSFHSFFLTRQECHRVAGGRSAIPQKHQPLSFITHHPRTIYLLDPLDLIRFWAELSHFVPNRCGLKFTQNIFYFYLDSCAMIRRRCHTITSYCLLHQLSLAIGTILIKSSNITVEAFTFANNPSIRPPRVQRLSTSSNSRTSSNMSILESPSAERNKHPIYDTVLSPIILPRLLRNNSSNSLKVLELAAGCGVHSTHFASSVLSSYPSIQLERTPSDPDAAAQASIDECVHNKQLSTDVVS